MVSVAVELRSQFHRYHEIKTLLLGFFSLTPISANYHNTRKYYIKWVTQESERKTLKWWRKTLGAANTRVVLLWWQQWWGQCCQWCNSVTSCSNQVVYIITHLKKKWFLMLQCGRQILWWKISCNFLVILQVTCTSWLEIFKRHPSPPSGKQMFNGCCMNTFWASIGFSTT